MASEVFKADQNHYRVIGGITSDSDQDVQMARIDFTTKRLLVDAILKNTSGTPIDPATEPTQLLVLAELEAILDALGDSTDVFNEFGEATAVASATETTVTSHTVPAGKTMRLKGIQATGESCAIFRVYVDAAQIWQGRIVWTERNINANVDITASAGAVVTLKVEHSETGTFDYQGLLFGTDT